MKLKEGMYVRTKKGIGKIDEIRDFMGVLEFHLDSNTGKIYQPHGNMYWNNVEDIIGEPSEHLIDLIEIGDYVNGYPVIFNAVERGGNIVIVIGGDCFTENKIKNIVTKEQFDNAKYWVER